MPGCSIMDGDHVTLERTSKKGCCGPTGGAEHGTVTAVHGDGSIDVIVDERFVSRRGLTIDGFKLMARPLQLPQDLTEIAELLCTNGTKGNDESLMVQNVEPGS